MMFIVRPRYECPELWAYPKQKNFADGKEINGRGTLHEVVLEFVKIYPGIG